MKSEHINLKLNQRYINKIKEIGQLIGIKDISSVYGAYPTIIKFSITLALQRLYELIKVIPTLHPADLEILLSSIKNKKILEYYQEIKETKEKTSKK